MRSLATAFGKRLGSLVGHTAAFPAVGMRVLVCVLNSPRSMDVAVATPTQCNTVVRFVMRAKKSDYHALKTMLAESDFDRAVLVYCDAEQPHLSNEIESWPIGEIDKLAASLAAWAQTS